MGLDLSQAKWRKSSHSSANGCVEVARVGEYVAIRDSKDQQGSALIFTPAEWRAFLLGVEDGEFGRP
jgi:Domain of unknown function (DUF397)